MRPAQGSPRALAPLPFVALLFAAPAWPISLPSNFVAENVTPSATWSTPVAVAFLPGGRMLVAEKRGRVYSVTNGVKSSSPMLNIESEVLNVADRGLLGIAVDPDYVSNHFVYLLYTVDPDSNGNDNNDDAFGRLTRYTVSFADSNSMPGSSRAILFGHQWTSGPVSCSQSHTIGSLRFASDGSLMVSVGDGASFSDVDSGGRDPSAFTPGRTDPYEDIGAFRAQSLSSLCGKILRLDPATGHGYAGNPYYDGDVTSKRSRIWAYGLRNPFRFGIKPGTGATEPAEGDPGTLYVGDVGWNRWEDLNVLSGGGPNFGWPCHEGPGPRVDYEAVQSPHNGCDSFGTPDNPAFNTPPISTWHHTNVAQSQPPEFVGNAAVGGVWYTGTSYPASWRGKYFMGDYGGDWIKMFEVDANDQLVGVVPFATGADAPVDFATDPATGDLVYVAIAANQIRRIRYTGAQGNVPPVAIATGTPDVGVAPLDVQFSGAGTTDANGDLLGYAWSFGDGGFGGGVVVNHTYAGPGTYDAVLTVNDGQGGVDTDSVRVLVASSSQFPTSATLDDFNRPNGPVGGAWVDEMAGLSIASNRLTQSGGYVTTVWNGGVFGPDQEAFMTLNSVTPTAPEYDLMLKVQGTSYAFGHIEVRYDPLAGSIGVSTHTPQTGWVGRAGPLPIVYAAGDQLGARAYSNGAVEVYKNGVAILLANTGDWPFAANGGRIGLTLGGTNGSTMDDFGGGNVVFPQNTPPTATITAPQDSVFVASGDTIRFAGSGGDAEDPPATLQLEWNVDLHHNNHTHPGTFVASGDSAELEIENHDDGTGVWWRASLRAADSGGLADTAYVDFFPDVELSPSDVTTVPGTPGTTAPATYSFRLRNLGRMPAPETRWRLVAAGVTLAEGDTLVAARDSVSVTRSLAPVLTEGDYTLRVVADTLGTALESNESNNANTRSLTVVAGAGPDELGPEITQGPTSEVSTTAAWIRWTTSERTGGIVRWGETRAFGDSLETPASLYVHFAALSGLAWATRCYFRVVALDSLLNPTPSTVDSFVTLNSSASADDRPLAFALRGPIPNPSRGAVELGLELAEGAGVRFAIHDLQGREVWSEPESERSAGRWTLRWPGTTASGAPQSPGLYWALVRVNGHSHLRRFALLR